jgi:hypothetical protein
MFGSRPNQFLDVLVGVPRRKPARSMGRSTVPVYPRRGQHDAAFCFSARLA